MNKSHKCLQIYLNNVSKLTTRNMVSIKLNKNKITPFAYLLLGIPITTFGLGCWQVQRKSWKEGLIRDLEQKVNAEPVDLPDDLADLSKMEYRSVRVQGHFLHDREIYLGPRSFLEKGDGKSSSGLFSAGNKGIGHHVITPFKIKGREEIILVNRGWIPRQLLNQSTRMEGQPQDDIELTGIVRLTEPRPQFSPESRGDHFLYRDIPKMCSMTGAEPIFLDARVESTVAGGPIGGQTRVTLRNDHLSYLVTWFSLSAFTSFMWYTTILKKVKW